MKPIIKVSNVSKKFILHHQGYKSCTLKEAFSQKIKEWLGLRTSFFTREEFWAIKDISFNVFPGERIGIIGNNGAGKSTLLKIISQIVPPTSGHITIHGRLASLLEVGTGFHPDLTGRENIFLNGTILGMSENEIKKHFEEIVHFAGIERFLDTPVKKYSSGMFARLGFSIAAHLNPDILVVDEVLSVGDQQFQNKCLKKLDSLSGEGTTIIFVSHNIGAILSLCQRGIYLKEGQIVQDGNIESCVNAYIQQIRNPEIAWKGDHGDSSIRFRNFLLDISSEQIIRQGKPLSVFLEFEIIEPLAGLILGIDIFNSHGNVLASARTSDNPTIQESLGTPGKYQLQYTFDTTHLRQGDYRMSAFCMIHNDRTIPMDPVNVNLQIYPSFDDERFLHPHRCEGIFLGNSWELSRSHNG